MKIQPDEHIDELKCSVSRIIEIFDEEIHSTIHSSFSDHCNEQFSVQELELLTTNARWSISIRTRKSATNIICNMLLMSTAKYFLVCCMQQINKVLMKTFLCENLSPKGPFMMTQFEEYVRKIVVKSESLMVVRDGLHRKITVQMMKIEKKVS